MSLMHLARREVQTVAMMEWNRLRRNRRRPTTCKAELSFAGASCIALPVPHPSFSGQMLMDCSPGCVRKRSSLVTRSAKCGWAAPPDIAPWP